MTADFTPPIGETVVLIPSCDNFSDVHPVALECLSRYWTDCPWRIVTMGNEKPWGPQCVMTGPDRGWTENLKSVLAITDFQFVLLFLDDMLLCRAVDTAACRVAENAMKMYPAVLGAIRLGQGPETTIPMGDVGFTSDGEPDQDRPGLNIFNRITLDSPYRISTSPTLWRVSYLRKILENVGPTAWDFEIEGTEFSRTQPEEIWVQAGEGDAHRAFRVYYTAITSVSTGPYTRVSKWNRGALNWLASIGVDVGELKRGVIEENDGRPM